MSTSATNPNRPNPGSKLPMRKESYTTWLYMGFAICVALLTIIGIWYAATPRITP